MRARGWSEFRETANTKFWTIDFPPHRNGIEIECNEMKYGEGERVLRTMKCRECKMRGEEYKADSALIHLRGELDRLVEDFDKKL